MARRDMRFEFTLWGIRFGIFLVVCLFAAFSPAAAQVWHPCGNSVALRVTPSASFQGGLLQLEVRSASPLASVKAEWAGRALPFWQDAGDEHIHRALLGIDLEYPAGRYSPAVTVELENSQHVDCSASVSVKSGRFTVERLHVEQKFVEPSPKEIERANQERQRLRDIFATVTPDKLWRGNFRLPLEGIKSAHNFGRRRILNGQPGSPHTGADFPAVAGTPVRAPQRGRVVLAEELYFSGNTIVLDHGLGLYTFYGHLSSIGVKAGDLVERDAILGQVGATGRVTGPHLHWGATVNDSRINPLELRSLRLE